MNQHDLTDDDIERLLLGTADPTGDASGALARVVDRIRTEYTSTTLPLVSAELAQFVNLNLVVNTNDLVAAASASSEVPALPTSIRIHAQQVRASIPQRRNKVRVAVGTFAGTLTAKVLLGSALALAAASGAQALGIVDIPLLPNFGRQHHVDNTPPDTVDDPPVSTDHPTDTVDNRQIDDDETDTTGVEADTTEATDDDETGTTGVEADTTEATDDAEAGTTGATDDAEAETTGVDDAEPETAGSP